MKSIYALMTLSLLLSQVAVSDHGDPAITHSAPFTARPLEAKDRVMVERCFENVVSAGAIGDNFSVYCHTDNRLVDMFFEITIKSGSVVTRKDKNE